MKFFRGVFLIVSVCTLVSCDAPRINPLDPESDAYKFSTISGKITAQVNGSALGDVKITWKKQGIVVYTNSSGQYSIEKLDRNDGWIYFEKNGYSIDSAYVQLVNQKTTEVDKILNAVPKLDEIKMITSVGNERLGDPKDSLLVDIRISDAEGDIDSAAIQNTDLKFYKKLTGDSSKTSFRGVFLASDFKKPSIIETIGTNFEIIAYDRYKRKFLLKTANVQRVITQVPVCLSPSNGSIVTNPFSFEWQKFEPRFNFTYTIELFDNTSFEPKLIEKPILGNLPGTKISSYDTKAAAVQLSAGTYTWYIWCVDDFGNRARSFSYKFTVQ